MAGANEYDPYKDSAMTRTDWSVEATARRLAEERLAKGEVPLIVPDVEIGINLGLAG